MWLKAGAVALWMVSSFLPARSAWPQETGAPGRAAQEVEAPKRPAGPEERIARMNEALKRLLAETARAREENDVKRLNCLLVKLNLLKGLLKASDQARAVRTEALRAGDAKTAEAYVAKIGDYHESAVEIERSLAECWEEEEAEGISLVYLRPEVEEAAEAPPLPPMDVLETPGQEGYPTIPPASPFR